MVNRASSSFPKGGNSLNQTEPLAKSNLYILNISIQAKHNLERFKSYINDHLSINTQKNGML